MHIGGDTAERSHPFGRDDAETLRAQLAEKDAQLSSFKEMIEQLMSMVSRYEAIAPKPAPGEVPSSGGLSREATEKVLELLDRAIVRAEQLSHDKHALQSNLDRTLSLLEDSLRNQEAISHRPPAAAPAHGPESASRPDQAALERALAKYDAMLERSLNALDEAYRASKNSSREIEERDRLLSRTLDALQQAVEAEPGEPGRKPFLGRLFG